MNLVFFNASLSTVYVSDFCIVQARERQPVMTSTCIDTYLVDLFQGISVT